MEDRLTLLHACSLYASARNIFGALLNGARLCPFDVKEKLLVDCSAWLMNDEITIYHSASVLFRNLAAILSGKDNFPHLRLIQLSSEAVTPTDIDQYKKHFSQNCIFANRLGTTEVGTFRRYFINHETILANETVPAGYAVDGTEVQLLDETGNEVAPYVIGEIAVKSRYLSIGYWRNAELTRAKFLSDPVGGEGRIYFTGDLGRMTSDRCLYYLGRKDFTTKIRGYRVSLVEIENVLRELDTVKEAVVAVYERQPNEKSLIAYVVPNGQAVPSALKWALADKLPSYMIPSRFVFLNALPVTPAGKIDRGALPHPGKSRPDLKTLLVTARTPIEEQLAEIWAGVLSLDRVGIHDNFFDLGGHSLAATRVVSQVIKKFQLEIPLQSLFQSPTVAEMAAVIVENQNKKIDGQDLNSILLQLESLSEDDAKELIAGQDK
jgi:acyl-coenzyme A synthetase/AMP-(fatty) acid ligase/acyl carrier protein